MNDFNHDLWDRRAGLGERGERIGYFIKQYGCMSRRDVGCEARAVGRRHENKLERVSFRGEGEETKGSDVSRPERESVGACVRVRVCV